MPTILSQDPNGRWTIKNIRHTSLQGVKIPATFTYNGIAVSFEIESTPKTVVTDWYTTPGEAGRLDIADMVNGEFPRVDDVKRVYTPVTYGGYSYKVMNESFSVTTYSGSDTGDTGVTYYLNVTDFVGFEYNTNLTRNIEVSTNVPSWTPSVVTGSSWLSVQKVSGGIKITATANTGAERDGRIKIVADGGEVSTKYISVTQAKKPSEQTPYIELSIPNYGSQYTADTVGETVSLSVQSNTGWTLSKSNNVTWVTIKDRNGNIVTGGTGNVVLFVTIGEYTSTLQNRGMTISGITNGTNSVYDTVKITQLKGSDTCTQEGTPCDCDGNDTCSSECVPYSPCSCDDECTQETEPCPLDGESIDVDTSRIDVECPDSFAGHEVTIEAEDDLTWTANAPDDWISASPTGGTGSSVVTISVLENNTGTTNRWGYVTFIDQNNNERQLTVEQAPTPRLEFASSSTEITIPTIGSVNSTYVYVSTNFGITPSNNGNTWISFEQEQSTYGRIKLYINVEEAASEERTGTVTITSNYNGDCETPTPITLTVTQIYEETPDPEKRDIVWLHKNQTSEREDPLEITVAANARDNIEFYIECNDNARVRERTLDGSETQDITIRETNNYDVSQGQTIQPTGLVDDGYSPRKLIATIPANTAMGEVDNARTFNVKFATFECSQLDARHCRTELRITQRGNSWIDSDYRIERFFLEDVMHDGQTSVEIEGDSYTWMYDGQYDTSLKVYLDVECTRHDAAQTQEFTLPVNDYLSGTGIDSNRLVITFKDGGNDINWINVAAGHTATTTNPYALEVRKNSGYEEGQARECDITIAYKANGGDITKTIHLTQKYKQVEPAELPLELYSQHGPSGTVSGKTITVQPSNGYVYFSLVRGDTNTPITYQFQMLGGDPDYWFDLNMSSPGSIDINDFEGEVQFPSGENTESFSLKLTNDALSDLSDSPRNFGIYAYKTTDSMVDTTLTLIVDNT